VLSGLCAGWSAPSAWSGRGYLRSNMLNIKDITNTVICGDSLEVMKSMPDNCVDLTVTSPPYDNLRDYKGFVFDFEGIAQQLYRVTKTGGVVVWVVGDATVNGSESGTSFRQALYFHEIGFNLHDTMIYEKAGCPFPETTRYYPVAEFMFILSKGKPSSINLIADKKNMWASSKTARLSGDRQKDGSMQPNSAYKKGIDRKVKKFGIRDNIWRYSIGKGNTTSDDYAFKHPAMFPEKLAKDHIISWSDESDTVLDPFSGSGTTAKMASLMGRNYIGIEIIPEYCDIARKRIQEAKDSMGLFKEQ